MCQARAALVPVICRASVSLCFKMRLMPYIGLPMQVKAYWCRYRCDYASTDASRVIFSHVEKSSTSCFASPSRNDDWVKAEVFVKKKLKKTCFITLICVLCSSE